MRAVHVPQLLLGRMYSWIVQKPRSSTGSTVEKL
jgi:hypothetical protein